MKSKIVIARLIIGILIVLSIFTYNKSILEIQLLLLILFEYLSSYFGASFNFK